MYTSLPLALSFRYRRKREKKLSISVSKSCLLSDTSVFSFCARRGCGLLYPLLLLILDRLGEFGELIAHLSCGDVCRGVFERLRKTKVSEGDIPLSACRRTWLSRRHMAPVALIDNVIAALTVPQFRTELSETHCMSSSILCVLKKHACCRRERSRSIFAESRMNSSSPRARRAAYWRNSPANVKTVGRRSMAAFHRSTRSRTGLCGTKRSPG